MFSDRVSLTSSSSCLSQFISLVGLGVINKHGHYDCVSRFDCAEANKHHLSIFLPKVIGLVAITRLQFQRNKLKDIMKR